MPDESVFDDVNPQPQPPSPASGSEVAPDATSDAVGSAESEAPNPADATGHASSPVPTNPETSGVEAGTPSPAAAPVERLVAEARAGRALTDADEQRIRDFYGYQRSETRTLAERDAAAARALLDAAPLPDVPAMAGIRQVWGDSPFPAQAIEAWGLQGFLGSAAHQAACDEHDRRGRLALVRAAYVKAFREQKGKK
ncbi:MAG TPA: hypothetical protein VH541_05680 [Gaiellaceae bacterium]|jgi:hypothetical protein